jgi:hypothetical protein
LTNHTGYALIGPQLPTLFTNYFAGRHAGGDAIDCEAFNAEDEPDACRDAYSDVATWASWASLFTCSCLSALCPIVGDISDRQVGDCH